MAASPHDVNIRPIQCQVNNVTGHALRIDVGTYSLVLMDGDTSCIRIFTVDTLPPAIESLATTLRKTRADRIPLKSRIGTMTLGESAISSLILLRFADSFL